MKKLRSTVLKEVKIKHSFACYRKSNGTIIGKVKECAKVLVNWPEIPFHIGALRAQEIGMLAKDYLRCRAALQKLNAKKKKVKK